ncbi:MAG TPA: hypothetical protein VFU76_00040 [Terriglobales bacterium]|nr:hypothetical protein [Terriglobales bacterium]
MATNPRLPESPGQPEQPEARGDRAFPWPLITVVLVILIGIGLAIYFFH